MERRKVTVILKSRKRLVLPEKRQTSEFLLVHNFRYLHEIKPALNDYNYLRILGKSRMYWSKIVKYVQTIKWSDDCLKAFDMYLAIAEFNFCWIALSGCNCCFIRQKQFFFSICVFFHNDSQITVLRRKAISLTPHYHLHPLLRLFDIIRAITVERSPLHIYSSQTRTGNLWFPSTSRLPLSYAP